MPMPRFEATRETAVARCRIAGGASEASRADWLGCKPPLPIPAAAAAANAWPGERRGHDCEAGDDADHETRHAEAEAPALVEVDDLERHHAAPAEVVEEDPRLDDPQLPRQLEAHESTNFVIVHRSHVC
jgi:hypothetical protein